MKRLFGKATFVLAALALLLLSVDIAHAQEVLSTKVNFQPLADIFIQIAAAALTGALGVFTVYICRKFKIELDTNARAVVMGAVERAVTYGASKAKGLADGKVTFDVKNEIIAAGAGYVMTKVPDAVARFKLDDQHVRDLVEAQLGKVLGVEAAVASPAVN